MDNTLLSAIIGAGAGLIGALLGAAGSYMFQKMHSDNQRRERVIEQYLFQLSEAIYSLQQRKENLGDVRNACTLLQNNEYFLTTTLYAMGAVWAYERILLLDGIYHELDKFEKGSGSQLMDLLKDVSYLHGLYRYHRMSLYEFIIEEKQGFHHVMPYIEFRRKLADPYCCSVLEPVKQYIIKHGMVDPNEKLPELEKKTSELLRKLGGTDRYSKLAERGR